MARRARSLSQRLLIQVVVLGALQAAATWAFILPPAPLACGRGAWPGSVVVRSGDGSSEWLSEEIYDRSRPPPLLITIGPQCGGKTSLLRRLNATRPGCAPLLLDVAIDDDRDVYRRVPMRAFLEGELEGPKDVRIRGRLASERCGDPGPQECRLVLGFLAGLWPLAEAEAGLAALPSTAGVLSELVAALPRAAEVFQGVLQQDKRGEDDSSSKGIGARFYSLFVPEAIPRAVKASNQRLSAALRDHLGPVAWGNTNSKASDFTGALRAAEAYGRRAILLRWGRELERVPLEELLVRNAMRATRMGRYIPAVSIKMALERTEALLARSSGGDAKALLTMAGFTADAQGRPRSNVPPPEESEPLIRPFAGVGAGEASGAATTASRPAAAAAPAVASVDADTDSVRILCTDTANWGAPPQQQRPQRRPVALDEQQGALGRARGRGDAAAATAGSGDDFVLSTGEWGGGAAGAAATMVGMDTRATRAQAATRALFLRGVRRAAEVLAQWQQQQHPLLVLRMGEWSKFKYWSKASYDMDWEWRRDFQRARNQTLADREEMIRLNGTDPWAVPDRSFDFELWTILRTLTGQNSNSNRF